MIYKVTTWLLAFAFTMLVFMPITLLVYFIIQFFHSIYLLKRFLNKRI
jgi:hypothetical protein